ncbi:unnamed protein product [Didymodactylos carnosus]|uniref:Disease resistance R13L4/SHOC-2-like LRR domain-containing protein n=1 Tax=Didymodactylos carnosus TaxID=1234261 RepID=A0A8S2X2S7_9BILA|nr:unnamed protein product [Didymodactylos carnosus]
MVYNDLRYVLAVFSILSLIVSTNETKLPSTIFSKLNVARKFIRISGCIESLDCSYFQTDLDVIKMLPYTFDQSSRTRYYTNSAKEVTDLYISGENNLPLYLYCLKNLQTLYIQSSDLIHLPMEIRNLQQLKTLQFYNNYNLVSIPDEIGELKSMEQLTIIGSPKLLTLPHQFEQLKNLQHIQFSSCGFEEIPKVITEMVGLQYLYLHYNKVTSIPYEIKRLTSLRALSLSGNPLKSLDELKWLTQLATLDLDSCQLNEFPINIKYLTNLSQLYIGGNNLTVIPIEIAKLQRLNTLELSSSKFTKLPRELTLLNSLTRLQLNNNHHLSDLTGIGSFQNLQELYLSTNNLTMIPKEIIKLSSTLI